MLATFLSIGQSNVTQSTDYPIEISVQAVKQMMDAGEQFLLLDCREQNEYDLCKIEGSTLIPMGETPERLEELRPHERARVVVQCHHGGRSMQVTQYLRAQGFTAVQNMAGGIDAWSVEIDQEIARY
jgi:rhodanese-related sulfurtransferase